MSLSLTLLVAWAAVALSMAGVWRLQRDSRNAGIVDVAWSIATAALGIWFALSAGGEPRRRAIVAVMAGLWGARLAIHLWRRMTREAEDGRYLHMRQTWGEAAQRRLFGFFQLQAFWAVMFALPMLAAASNTLALGWQDALGVAFWVAALVGESTADGQLARFKARAGSTGKVCQTGLWRYSRHPNYFFEWLHWWGYACLAAGSPLWWVAAAGVLVMLWFLVKVTGVPPTEAQALRSRGEAYRRYQRTTSVFFPWMPRGERE